jgi:hypothetical protein
MEFIMGLPVMKILMFSKKKCHKVSKKKVKLSLYQAVKAHRGVRG